VFSLITFRIKTKPPINTAILFSFKKEALDKIDLFFRCQIIHFDVKGLVTARIKLRSLRRTTVNRKILSEIMEGRINRLISATPMGHSAIALLH